MAGGSGTRFWPKSTSKCPKQLLSFEPGRPTLIEETVRRFESLVSPDQVWIVTTQKLESAVQRVFAKHGNPPRVLAEPEGRNTAPCVFWAAQEIAKDDPDAIMMVMPSDHTIPHLREFQNTIAKAAQWARETGDLVTLGVKPTRPETGYGYLKKGNAITSGGFRVERFVEKPDLARAKDYVASGEYYWNGGMFLWTVKAILEAFEKFMPEMKRIWDETQHNVTLAYPKMTATSIDYGVMEKAKNVSVFELDCGWDDLGSWTSIENLPSIKAQKNPWGQQVAGEVLSVESRNCLVDVPQKVVALLGVEDLIVVEASGVLMVAKKDRAQDVKKLVDLAKASRPEIV